MNHKLPDLKLDLEKAEEPEIKLPKSVGSLKKQDFPGGSDGKASAYNEGDLHSIPGLGRSPGGGHGNPLQYSHLENPMDRGDWWAAVRRVAKSWT